MEQQDVRALILDLAGINVNGIGNEKNYIINYFTSYSGSENEF